MASKLTRCLALAGIPLVFQAAGSAFAGTEEMGNGFFHHGVATVSNHRDRRHRGWRGRNVVISGTTTTAGIRSDDRRGTGRARVPSLPHRRRRSLRSVLSSANKFYTHFGSHFTEFDPVKGEFTFYRKTVPQMAMGMTEDDNGVIWSVTYPNSGVASYNPKTGEFKDYGHVYRQNWRQYQRYVAADDQGWLYFAVGNTQSQIIALDPATGQATPLVPESERAQGSAYVYRDLDGKVYGQALAGRRPAWRAVWRQGPQDRQAGDTAAQADYHRQSGAVPSPLRWQPDRRCDTVERILCRDQRKSRRPSTSTIRASAHIMGLAAADGTICGGTAFPMRFFSSTPRQISG